MLKITNKKGFFIEISILSKSDKKVLKFKMLFYAKGTEVRVSQKINKNHFYCLLNVQEVEKCKKS